MTENKNPYHDITLSTDTDSEQEYQTYQKFLVKSEPKKKKVVLSGKSKKYEQFNNLENLIKEHFKKEQYDLMKSEYDNINNLLGKFENFVNKYGTPKSYLRVINFLNDNIYKDDLEHEKLEKIDVKAIKFLRQKIKQKFDQYQHAINNAVINNTLDVNEVSEHEDVKATAKKGDDDEDEDDIQELDFNARLTLSKEDRRKFWMVKEKVVKKGAKKRKANIQLIQNMAEEKEFLEEKDEFMRFDLRILVSTLKKINDEKAQILMDDIAYNLRFLKAMIDKLDMEAKDHSAGLSDQDIQQRKTEIYLLILYFFQEIGTETGIYSSKLFGQFFDNLKNLKQIIDQNPQMGALNYDKGDKQIFQKEELIKKFHQFVTKLNTEFEYALQLIDPFNEQFQVILNQKTQFFLEFFDELKELYKKVLDDENEQNKLICDIYLKQVENIYHLSDDFVLNCEELSEYFEEKAISDNVQQFVSYLKSHLKDSVKQLKANLYVNFNKALNEIDLENVHKELTEIQYSEVIQSSHQLVCLYNRVLCRLGLSYFKKGNLQKCKEVLHGICNSGNLQKNLYQYNPQQTRIIDEDNPLNLQPYHMHLNTDEIEVCFLICSVLFDTHKILSDKINGQSSVDNKILIQFLKNYEENLFVNSKNNSKDCVFVCYRKIMQSEYQMAFGALKEIVFIQDNESLLKVLQKQITLESFYCYVEKLKNIKSVSLSAQNLASVFSMNQKEIVEILKRRLSKGDLDGTYDEDSQIVQVKNDSNKFLQTDLDWELFDKAIKLHQYSSQEKAIVEKGQKFKGKNINSLNQIMQSAFPYTPGPFSFVKQYDFNQLKKEYTNQ